jgi:class 3 adenylate cyclase
MAAFRSPARALEAALDMIARVRRQGERHGLAFALRVGVHEGPCLVVRANGRLDFYGTTVNTAARLQGQARGGRVVVAAQAMEHPDVERLVAERGLTVEHFRAELKGLRDVRALLSLAAPEGSVSMSV